MDYIYKILKVAILISTKYSNALRDYSIKGSLMEESSKLYWYQQQKYTHTHTHMYIYIYVFLQIWKDFIFGCLYTKLMVDTILVIVDWRNNYKVYNMIDLMKPQENIAQWEKVGIPWFQESLI